MHAPHAKGADRYAHNNLLRSFSFLISFLRIGTARSASPFDCGYFWTAILNLETQLACKEHVFRIIEWRTVI